MKERKGAEQKLVKFILNSLGESIVHHDENIVATFKLAAKTCKYRGEQHKKTKLFPCNNPDLEDIHFNWACRPGACPYMNRAMDWRANNMNCNVWTKF